MRRSVKIPILLIIAIVAIFILGNFFLYLVEMHKIQNDLGIIDVKAFGAKGDGITDDTKAIEKAIEAAPEGSIIVIPPGEYKCNITILKSNITIAGERGHNYSGSYLTPFDTTKPCVQIGDGKKDIRNIKLDNISLVGTDNPEHYDSVGLKIYGIYYLYTSGLNIEKFGGNNVEIDSDKIPSSYIYFNNFRTGYSQKSAFYVNYGKKWSTAIYLDTFSAEVGPGDNSRCITLKDKILLNCSNGWIQSKNYKGIELYGDSKLNLTNVQIDSDDSNDVLVKQFDEKISRLYGLYTLDGYIENSEGIKMPTYGSGYLSYKTTLRDPLVHGNIFLIDKNKFNSEEDYIPTDDNRIVLSSGRLYFYNNGKYFYFDESTQQLRNFATHGGSSNSRPSNPIKYQQYYDSTLNKLIIYDGSKWRDAMGNIVGN
ncbi:glycosyl hydrolase family 28-related protein [Wukongibacter baidiensis]|uniref:glycosyl hydrolase family 28-related protein n=1 Tax=Wukongibacter baidiensis TaxID=1723361 RepID=UPI003D7FCF77